MKPHPLPIIVRTQTTDTIGEKRTLDTEEERDIVITLHLPVVRTVVVVVPVITSIEDMEEKAGHVTGVVTLTQVLMAGLPGTGRPAWREKQEEKETMKVCCVCTRSACVKGHDV